MNISGSSMEPTLKHGESVTVDFSYYNKSELKKGDIIVYKLKTRDELFVKRVIALPGDKVVFSKDNKLYVNDKQLKEDYLGSDISFNPSHISLLIKQLEAYNSIIPPDSVMVLGDNRANSIDSGTIGLLPKEYIIGKVIKY